MLPTRKNELRGRNWRGIGGIADEPGNAEYERELRNRAAEGTSDHDAGQVLAGEAANRRVDGYEQLGQVSADRQN